MAGDAFRPRHTPGRARSRVFRADGLSGRAAMVATPAARSAPRAGAQRLASIPGHPRVGCPPENGVSIRPRRWRPGAGRPAMRIPCPACGLDLSARELRGHLSDCIRRRRGTNQKTGSQRGEKPGLRGAAAAREERKRCANCARCARAKWLKMWGVGNGEVCRKLQFSAYLNRIGKSFRLTSGSSGLQQVFCTPPETPFCLSAGSL